MIFLSELLSIPFIHTEKRSENLGGRSSHLMWRSRTRRSLPDVVAGPRPVAPASRLQGPGRRAPRARRDAGVKATATRKHVTARETITHTIRLVFHTCSTRAPRYAERFARPHILVGLESVYVSEIA